MTHGTRWSGLARFAAALLALSLTGAPRLVGAAAPEKPHQCRCRRHVDGECACARCASASKTARADAARRAPPGRESRRAGVEPPCHRAPAAVGGAPESRRRPVRTTPCIEGNCGGDAPGAVTPTGVDPFTPLPAEERALSERRASRATPGPRAGRRAPVPEPPPPRPA